jgi:hypothetical protein
MSKEAFLHRRSTELLELLDQAARASGKRRGQSFEDFLELVVCSLSGGKMEEQYLKVARRYGEGEPGKRGIDLLARTFGALVTIMEETRADILGDLYQGAITRGENGQFMTPETVTDCMARLVGHDENAGGQKVLDCCCGSGRMLLSAAQVNPNRLFVGQDVDLRSVSSQYPSCRAMSQLVFRCPLLLSVRRLQHPSCLSAAPRSSQQSLRRSPSGGNGDVTVHEPSVTTYIPRYALSHFR